MRSARGWRAGDKIVNVGDGSELAEIERAKRAAKPWLYEAVFISPEASANPTTSHYASVAPIGIPIAVKIGVAIGQARTRKQLAASAAHAAAAHASGLIAPEVATAIDDAVLEKEKGLAWYRGWWQRIAPPQILNRVVDRRPRIEHRAKLAASGPMPPDLAKKFTQGELAVMKIVADEVALHGTCRITKKEIRDRAKASETTVHNAVRKGVHLAMLSVKQRPVQGRKSLPNLMLIIDLDWMLWVARPKYRAIREDRLHPQPNQGANRSTPQSVHTYKKDYDGVWRGEEEAVRGSEGARPRSPHLRNALIVLSSPTVPA